MQAQTPEQQQQSLWIRSSTHSQRDATSEEEREDEDEAFSFGSTLSAFRAKEEQIERKKMEIRERVFARLGRVEEESKTLAMIRKELEAVLDPTRKEVLAMRKKIDMVNRELKLLSQNCLKKEKEYIQAREAFDDKNREKALLVSRLMEAVSESERLRMKKLEELSKTMDSIR
ncbi:RAB6-interacting golgin-like [Zingiber officinale]|uniref:RAB6-interacting golgin-like n=1 Tax=Zingiber officinale TaxID=94328 RepID=UPI001C4A985B|nr:RAB6-interacting golgin-like [Zingiber officinale]